MGTQLPSSFDGNTDFYEENRWQKFTRRIKEEPLVPFGCAVTCVALYRASRAIRRKESHNANRYFRWRIYGQAFTLLCIYAGSIFYAEDRKKRKEVAGAIAEKKAAEKRDLWIRELEAREEEDQQERQRRDVLRSGGDPTLGLSADTRARKEAMVGMDAERREKRGARAELREGGVAKAVLERAESRRGVLELVRALR